jgi:hypothetical protein
MQKKIITALLTVALLAPTAAFGCSIPSPPPTFRSALTDATAVFVFRLDKAEYKRDNYGSGARTSWVEGRIRLIQNLYGDPVQYRRIRFPTHWCGGVNLVVGHHYLIATRQAGDTIELASSDGSILDIEGFYDPSRKGRNLRSFLIRPVTQALYGIRPLPEDYPPSLIAGRTVVQPPPPLQGHEE